MLSVGLWSNWLDRLDLAVATLLGLLIGTWLVVRRRRRIGIGPAPDRVTSYGRVVRRQRLVVLVVAWALYLVVRAFAADLALTSPDAGRVGLTVRGVDAALLAFPLAPLLLQLGALLSQTAALPSTAAADRAPWRGASTSARIAPVFWSVVLAAVLWLVALVMFAIDLGATCRTDAPCLSVTAPVVSLVSAVSAATLVGALVLFLALLLAMRRTLGAHGEDPDDTAVIRAATSDAITRATTDAILLSIGAAAVLVGASATSGFDVSWAQTGSFGWISTGPLPGEPMPYLPVDGSPSFGTTPSGLIVLGVVVRSAGMLLVAWAWTRILLHNVRR